MRKREDRPVLQMAQESDQATEQFAEQSKAKTFRLEQFLKTHRRTKMGPYTWKTSQHGDVKEQE
ncbi:hypothetical protein P8M94_004917 [Escherichia coli]|nr:hypothetical protein [Escherichia coli]